MTAEEISKQPWRRQTRAKNAIGASSEARAEVLRQAFGLPIEDWYCFEYANSRPLNKLDRLVIELPAKIDIDLKASMPFLAQFVADGGVLEFI